IGGGPGFINRTFDLKTNNKNNIISSKFNYCLNGRINITQRIYKQLYLNAGLGIIHFSNGNLKVPNLGINVPTIHIGLGFGSADNPRIIRDTLSPFKKKSSLFLSLAGGMKQNYPILGPNYGIGVFSIYGGRAVSRKSILQLGFEVFYDPSIQRTLGIDLNAVQNSRLGLLFGHELTFNKLSLLTQGGIYLYDPYKLYQPWYQRYGLKYYLSPDLFIGVFLKAHYGSADFVEWTLGVKI
ncbi:MAG TPA: acyloxyacyl hydrolase, partial [Cytophagaceae bacterium]